MAKHKSTRQVITFSQPPDAHIEWSLKEADDLATVHDPGTRPTTSLGWNEGETTKVDLALKEGWNQGQPEPDTNMKALVERITEGISEPKGIMPRHKGTGTARKYRSTEYDRLMANRKTADPDKHPTMTAREIAAYLGLGSIKAVYDHTGIEPSPTGNRSRRWTTKSVIAIKNSPPY